MLLPDPTLGDDSYHWNVTFTNNRIKSFNGHLAHARSVKGLVLSGNIIELDEKYPEGTELPAVDLDFCSNVQVENNRVDGVDIPVRLEGEGKTTGLVLNNNSGLSQ